MGIRPPGLLLCVCCIDVWCCPQLSERHPQHLASCTSCRRFLERRLRWEPWRRSAPSSSPYATSPPSSSSFAGSCTAQLARTGQRLREWPLASHLRQLRRRKSQSLCQSNPNDHTPSSYGVPRASQASWCASIWQTITRYAPDVVKAFYQDLRLPHALCVPLGPVPRGPRALPVRACPQAAEQHGCALPAIIG